ncbi:hypothetical protein BAE36_27505 [Rhizobium leguminosarum bv. trifolii]|nr:hypothetical protein CHR56_26810 [Rhizobium leguminosarum bv. viciae]OBY04056.1 hypothetical protein BAE36_27505 [Rhizobium leguminosarum bv. trifolii]OOO46745.1 hypothetical protein BS629_19245 [Rhizobium leguminosarum bv. viciae USDA 2370]RWX26115.1 hypothetical protein EHH54_35180 [Rhizobium leguminosarum]NKJ84482.1 hypothetical protein [Rhizobium leguminosarum bv. viciae]
MTISKGTSWPISVEKVIVIPGAPDEIRNPARSERIPKIGGIASLRTLEIACALASSQVTQICTNCRNTFGVTFVLFAQ